MNYIKQILSITGSEKKFLPWILFIFLISTFLDTLSVGLIFPLVTILLDGSNYSSYLYKYFPIDFLENISYEKFVIYFVIFLAILYFLKCITSVIVQWIIINYSNNLMLDLRKKLMHSFQDLDYELYISRNSSEYIHSINNLTSLFSGKIINVLLKAICDTLVGFFILVFLVINNPGELIILFLVVSISYFIYDKMLKNKIKMYGKKANLSSEKILQTLNESMRGYKEIKTLGKESTFFNILVKHATRFSDSMTRFYTLSVVPRYLFEFIILLFVLSLIVVEVINGNDTSKLFPTLATFGVASLRLLPALNSVSNAISSLRFNRNTIDKLYYDLEGFESKKCAVKDQSVKVIDEFQELKLKDVAYRYPGSRSNSLSSISIQIKKGETIGIVGESGSGKTTLVDLIIGFLKPQAGTVFFNEKNIFSNLRQWRDHIAYLPQEAFISDNSVYKNISLDLENIDKNQELVDAALKASSLTSFVETLPKGILTNLGENGISLSGGQKQRIALARSIYHQRDVLILDESTSALDSKTEDDIVKQIGTIKGSVTILIIAHRYSTLQYCDRIYHMSNGSISNVGTYEELINKASDKLKN
jgi:ABC-type bacteriocin/lantibiotic exporter with double-glycine peptidase domain